MSSLSTTCPKYETSIPSTETKIWFRPILVKEEKKLVVVQQFGSENEIIKAMVETINDCFGLKNSELLPVFDLEYLFLKLRSKSIGSVIDLSFICNETGEKIKSSINIDEIEIQYNPDHTREIKLDNQFIVKMKYPTANDFMDFDFKNINSLYKMASKCMEEIQTTNERIICSEQSEKELEDFLDNLTPIDFNKITCFFETMPKIEKVIEYKTSDGETRSLTIKGIKDFF